MTHFADTSPFQGQRQFELSEELTHEQRAELDNLAHWETYTLRLPRGMGPEVAGTCHVFLRRVDVDTQELIGPGDWAASWNTWHRGQVPARGNTAQDALDALLRGESEVGS